MYRYVEMEFAGISNTLCYKLDGKKYLKNGKCVGKLGFVDGNGAINK